MNNQEILNNVYTSVTMGGNLGIIVFHAFDRNEQKVDAGVGVTIKGKHAATVHCSGKNIDHDLEGINLKTTGE